MTAATRPRGPLPRRVYWVRRLVLAGIVATLVLGVAKIIDTTVDGGTDPAQATTAGASASSQTAETGSGSASAGDTAGDTAVDKAELQRRKQARSGLAVPSGPCEDSDVVITPHIGNAHEGSPVKVVLELTTRSTPACTWEVSPESVFVTVSKKSEPLWSSQECPGAIPTVPVVPRQKKADKVTFFWSGRASDASCSAATTWLAPGVYQANAVARGSVDAVDEAFLMGSPKLIPPQSRNGEGDQTDKTDKTDKTNKTNKTKKADKAKKDKKAEKAKAAEVAAEKDRKEDEADRG